MIDRFVKWGTGAWCVVFCLLLVCVGGAALRMHDLVGLGVVMVGGVSTTLSTGPSPSDMVNYSTL